MNYDNNNDFDCEFDYDQAAVVANIIAVVGASVVFGNFGL